MGTYKIRYTYIDFTNNIHGKRISDYDEVEADSAQEAVDQVRQSFYTSNELKITSVSKWSYAGYWDPVFDTAWK